MYFLIKKFLEYDKNFFIYLKDYLCQIKIFLLNMLKLLKIQGFLLKFQIFFLISQKQDLFFCLNYQIPDFSMFFQVKWQISKYNSRSKKICLQSKNYPEFFIKIKTILSQLKFKNKIY